MDSVSEPFELRTPSPGTVLDLLLTAELIRDLEDAGAEEPEDIFLHAAANADRLLTAGVDRVPATILEVTFAGPTMPDGSVLKLTSPDDDACHVLCPALCDDDGTLLVRLTDFDPAQLVRVDTDPGGDWPAHWSGGVECGREAFHEARDEMITAPAPGGRVLLRLSGELADAIAANDRGYRRERAQRIAARMRRMLADGHRHADAVLRETRGAGRRPHRRRPVRADARTLITCEAVCGDAGLLWVRLDDLDFRPDGTNA